ncbi:MAG: flagellar hook-associated protein FlgL [bacterium]|jgi:flagellar hook-associated protein 3 FlgL
MRVTNSMLINNFLRNLNNNLARLERTQNRLATGKRISRPSDDPSGLAYSMGLRANLAALERYEKNVDTAQSWLEATDSALDSATNILHRAKELAVYGASETLDEQSREALAEEVGQLLEEMRQVANTNFAGRYIFAGNKTLEEPYPSSTDFSYMGTETERQVEIGVNIVIPYSVTGDRVFGDGDTGILKTLQELQGALDGTGELAPGDLLDDLDAGLDHILSIRAEVGARVNRLELVNNRLEDTHFSYTRLLSETENADIAETIIELKAQENVYLASLGAGARIIQPSLLDFLR